ncbi:MAG: type II toxin-antitoxin system RelE/ParE family toxin [Acidobacteriaceae bacterium]|nr:type II toxin-antitoxin system RelE/ParE family toxin [Acidobacteriaceae bacterium]
MKSPASIRTSTEEGGDPRTLTPRQPRASVAWEGDSRDKLLEWSKDVRVDFGHALNEMQEGRMPTLQSRRMSTIGDGVYELKTDDTAKWYRLMYIARLEDVIYILDCFEKDTAKTEKNDLSRSKARYQQVHQRLLEERKNAKRKEKHK